MLTIKQITENTEAVLRGLEKKHFKNAKETIDQVIALNDKRRSTQNELDKNLAEVNSLSRTIGQLMKEGKKEEAETARARVAELKEGNKELDAAMTQAATDMQNVLYTIPNIPYDSVPEGVGAEDNVVEKMGGMETELPKDALPHWELAKKYDLIDFDLGVKITGAGFPVYKGKGAQLQRALINFFLDEARKSGYTEIMPTTVVNAASGYGTGQLPDKEGYDMEVPVFATDLLRGRAFPDEIVWSVPVCQCEPILLWRIRADDSVRAHLYHRNQLHDGNIVYRRNS